MEKVRVRVLVCGHVQGVCFRASACDEARSIGGITGFVRNLPDGHVELVCEGSTDSVKKLIDWLKHGPPLAHVDNVKVEWEKATGEYKNFGTRF